MIRVLTLTNLYPNSIRPQLGLFVEHRMRRVAALDGVEVKVVAPVPWFPFRSKRFGSWAEHAAVPEREDRNGIEVHHPRYKVIPKIGMRFGPALMARGVRSTLRRLIRDGFDFDVLDAHYLYPDGVAAVRLGKELGKPVVMTARGSDVNLIPRVSAFAKRAVVTAATECAGVICVSEALRAALIELGAPADNIEVIRNGVDRELFAPPAEDRPTDRPPTILSVGNLVPLKGHDLVIAALEWLPAGTRLRIAGRGPMRDALEAAAAAAGVQARVEFLGSVDQDRLRSLYGEADVTVLASAEEGLPNVVLESMACGTPVVATRVGGIPEAVRVPDGGALMDERTAQDLAAKVSDVLANPRSRESVRRVTDDFDWQECAAAVRATFERVLASRGR